MRNDKLDELNIKLLKALEQNSRRSLKELAAELQIKTSTIYHRLHRLKERKILEGFSIIVNPNEMNLSQFNFITVSIKNLNVKHLDQMFLDSFAQYLSNEFEDIQFVSTSRTKVYLISCHLAKADSEEFLEKLRQIPYVESLDIIPFEKIVKGHKLFVFNSSYFKETASEETPSQPNPEDLNGDSPPDFHLEDDDDLE